MLEVREINRGLIAIDKKTSVDYYTYAEAKEIKKQLNILIKERTCLNCEHRDISGEEWPCCKCGLDKEGWMQRTI